ncbi:hypothetical protein [Methanobacterium subterraneum]|nr:hypothetical protein [Methanobacterium subterraneum]
MSRKSYPEKVPLSDVGKEPDKPPVVGMVFWDWYPSPPYYP